LNIRAAIVGFSEGFSDRNSRASSLGLADISFSACIVFVIIGVVVLTLKNKSFAYKIVEEPFLGNVPDTSHFALITKLAEIELC
jgi:hypothetical protein